MHHIFCLSAAHIRGRRNCLGLILAMVTKLDNEQNAKIFLFKGKIKTNHELLKVK